MPPPFIALTIEPKMSYYQKISRRLVYFNLNVNLHVFENTSVWKDICIEELCSQHSQTFPYAHNVP